VRRDRGVVLLLVMAVVAVLAALAVELAARAGVDVLLASRSLDESAFRRLADSGIEFGKGLLREPEAGTYDFWGELWNQEVRLPMSPSEAVVVRVSDESGKINIARKPGTRGDPTRLTRELHRLFEYLERYEPGRTEELRDLERRLDLRLGLIPPEEGDVAPDPLLTLDGLREAGIGTAQIFGKGGLAQYLTCFGDGKVNVNTAPRAVLYALDPEIDAQMADRISAYRGDADGRTGTYKAFEEPKDLELVDGMVDRSAAQGQARVVRNLYLKIQPRVTTRSTAFGIRVTCRVGERSRDVWAFFEPSVEARAGEKPRRALRRLAYEEILP